MGQGAMNWLALRESQDRVSRSAELVQRLATYITPGTLLVDLACGTGANVRYISRRLDGPVSWRCLDNDPDVLAEARLRFAGMDDITADHLDLALELPEIGSAGGLVWTTSAFLDLTSAEWLDQLASRCQQAPLLAAMTQTDTLSWEPMMAADEPIRHVLQQYRKGDHGFGPALGGEAAAYLIDRLRSQGNQVLERDSSWRLAAGASILLETMITGIARRVRSLSADIDIEGWESQRLAQFHASGLSLTVGHVDILSLPA